MTFRQDPAGVARRETRQSSTCASSFNLSTSRDKEHPDVSLTHETEWCLSAFPSGLLVWENVEDKDANPRHMKAVPRDKVLALWLKFAQGDIAAVEAEPWLPGYY